MSFDIPDLRMPEVPEVPEELLTINEVKEILGEGFVDVFHSSLMISPSLAAQPEFIDTKAPFTKEELIYLKKEGLILVQVPDFLLHTVESGLIDDDILAASIATILSVDFDGSTIDLAGEYGDSSTSNVLLSSWLVIGGCISVKDFSGNEKMFRAGTVLETMLSLIVLYKKNLIKKDEITGKYTCFDEGVSSPRGLIISMDDIFITTSLENFPAIETKVVPVIMRP